jgi:hypothetical protein
MPPDTASVDGRQLIEADPVRRPMPLNAARGLRPVELAELGREVVREGLRRRPGYARPLESLGPGEPAFPLAQDWGGRNRLGRVDRVSMGAPRRPVTGRRRPPAPRGRARTRGSAGTSLGRGEGGVRPCLLRGAGRRGALQLDDGVCQVDEAVGDFGSAHASAAAGVHALRSPGWREWRRLGESLGAGRSVRGQPTRHAAQAGGGGSDGGGVDAREKLV